MRALEPLCAQYLQTLKLFLAPRNFLLWGNWKHSKNRSCRGGQNNGHRRDGGAAKQPKQCRLTSRAPLGRAHLLNLNGHSRLKLSIHNRFDWLRRCEMLRPGAPSCWKPDSRARFSSVQHPNSITQKSLFTATRRRANTACKQSLLRGLNPPKSYHKNTRRRRHHARIHPESTSRTTNRIYARKTLGTFRNFGPDEDETRSESQPHTNQPTKKKLNVNFCAKGETSKQRQLMAGVSIERARVRKFEQWWREKSGGKYLVFKSNFNQICKI